MFDPEKFGAAMGEAIKNAIEPLQKRITELEGKLEKELGDMAHDVQEAVTALHQLPEQIPGPPGEKGEKGADGIGVAGAMIDREGALQLTLANGEVKNLGIVVGKDGITPEAPKDGKDGIGFESFEMEYIAESHEVLVKASAAGRVKELRYPAGGIRPAGYWREGAKAKSGEAWVHDGSMYIALKDTSEIPTTRSDCWIIGARRGKDGDNVIRQVKPAGPIALGK